ncbi:MAG TPA: HAD family hydrolase [Candidatus Limnocylindrales bacterium]|nr:HAD family hydrolase [Candidatus Limnocylindrales bacterium]
MTRPVAVLFDLDDTLYPERSFVDGGFRSVGRFLAPHIGSSPAAIARRLRTLHDRDGRGRLIQTLLGDLGRGDDPDLVLAAVLAYRTHRPRLYPFPMVVETLGRLRAAGISTGLVSDGMSAVQRRKLAALPAVARQLDVIVLTDELGADYAKPSPVPFRVACRMLGVDPAASVYVANDPRKDFAGARAAGLATIRSGSLPDEGGAIRVSLRDGIDADAVTDGLAEIGRRLLEEPI